MSQEDSFVTLSDGTKVHVKLLGIDKSKPLLIALHGAPGLSDHREPQASFSFLSTRFRVLVYDARGSGISGQDGPYTDEQWISDVDELRAWAGDEKFVLAGGSYGGFLAQQYVLAYPQHVAALILRDTWANGTRGAMTALANLITSPRLQPNVPRQIRVWSGNLRDNDDFLASVTEIFPAYTAPLKGEDTSTVVNGFDRIEEADYKLNYKAQNSAFGYSQPRFDARPRLGEIGVPTLVVVGRHDPVAPVEFSEEIAAGIPKAELAIFENSGHSPPAEEPEAFQERVTKFLSGLGY